ncbi:MAG TPA: hypothetical protein VG992_02795 [Candidatus Saccharimonadales bacterium]|nr:hypothetical protein [Candidatus Saccharimonadales bacterium]
MQIGPNDLTNQQLLTALAQQLGVMSEAMATKDDLRKEVAQIRSEMATKDDLRKEVAQIRSEMATKEDLTREVSQIRSEMATKEDLKAFATKEDIANMATKDDLKAFATKDDLVAMAHAVTEDLGGVIRDAMAVIGDQFEHLRAGQQRLERALSPIKPSQV